MYSSAYNNNCIAVKKLRYFKDQFNILTEPTVTTLSEFCISTLIGGSGASSLVEILLPQCIVCGVGFGGSTFIFSAEPNRTHIYVELQSPGEDGPPIPR